MTKRPVVKETEAVEVKAWAVFCPICASSLLFFFKPLSGKLVWCESCRTWIEIVEA